MTKIDELARENYKQLLECTDEELDKLIKVANDIAVFGFNVNFDVLVSMIAKEIDSWLFGDGIGVPTGILNEKTCGN